MQAYVALLRGVNVGGKICKMELVRAVFERLGFSAVKTYVQSGNVIFAAAQASPLRLAQTIAQAKLHVTFLSEAVKQTATSSLQALAVNGEQFHVLGQQIYLYCPNGYGRTKLSNNAIEKKLSVVATTRNWRSVTTLLTMMQSGS